MLGILSIQSEEEKQQRNLAEYRTHMLCIITIVLCSFCVVLIFIYTLYTY